MQINETCKKNYQNITSGKKWIMCKKVKITNEYMNKVNNHENEFYKNKQIMYKNGKNVKINKLCI